MSKQPTSKYITLVSALIILSVSIISCGFAYEKQIVGKYYIIGVDTKDDLGLSYNLGGGSFVGKTPGKLIAYGFNDTFLVAKTTSYLTNSEEFYLIDMTKDSDYAHEKDFRIGPLTEVEYDSQWNHRLKIKLINVQSQ